MPTKAQAQAEALRQHTRFDWSVKRLLRNKTNYVVLDGFLTALLGEPIKMLLLLESEGSKGTANSKSNRVDLPAQDSLKRKIIIEIQNSTELDYFHRMLFGTAKAVAGFTKQDEGYGEIGRIFSVNIVYFDLGHGSDYVYRGRNEFRGVHTNDILEKPNTPKTPQKPKTNRKPQSTDRNPMNDNYSQHLHRISEPSVRRTASQSLTISEQMFNLPLPQNSRSCKHLGNNKIVSIRFQTEVRRLVPQTAKSAWCVAAFLPPHISRQRAKRASAPPTSSSSHYPPLPHLPHPLPLTTQP
jgi:hypothetical protein